MITIESWLSTMIRNMHAQETRDCVYTPRIQHRDDRFGGRKHAVTPCTWHDFTKVMLCNETVTQRGRGQTLAIFG